MLQFGCLLIGVSEQGAVVLYWSPRCGGDSRPGTWAALTRGEGSEGRGSEGVQIPAQATLTFLHLKTIFCSYCLIMQL